MAEYRWVTGARIKGDAAAIGAELERIRQSGHLTPEAVVKAARRKSSPLHSLIYDGTTADEALASYHHDRAKYVLRSIEIVEGESQTVEVRGFQVVTIGDRREYVPAREIRDTPEFREEVRQGIIRELQSWRRRLKGWDEFVAVSTAIDVVLEGFQEAA